MGIRFRSYSVYGLGYCPHHELISNNHSEFCVWYVHILLLDYALICTHFGRFLDEFDFWSFCVQQFWACKFTVLLCLLVRRREAKCVVESWREERSWYTSVCVRMTIFRSSCSRVCDDIKFYMETELIYVHIVEWGDWFGWRPNCCASSVSPYLRSLQFAIPRNCVVLTYHSVRWWTARRLWYNRLVLCELAFSMSSNCTA